MNQSTNAARPAGNFLVRAFHETCVALKQIWNSDYVPPGYVFPKEPKFEPRRTAPYIFIHVGCLALFWVGWSWFAVALAAFLYVVRMFAITAFYHRYFSHKAFRTSRFM